MEPGDPQADDHGSTDDGLTDEERAAIAAGGELVDDAGSDGHDREDPYIEGPNPR